MVAASAWAYDSICGGDNSRGVEREPMDCTLFDGLEKRSVRDPMSSTSKKKRSAARCTPKVPVDKRGADVSLPVIAVDPETGMKRSRAGIWRAYVLIGVHVLMLGHFLHWIYAGNTLTPVEPSESAEFFRRGEINMGLIFFGLAILATLVFGRFVCGWGCHLIAYQDLMLWVLKKLHLRPKAFRTRFLVFIPLVIAAGWMFILPMVVRLWAEFYAKEIVPPSTWHLARTGFWDTFPTWPWAIVSVFFAGFAIIYFLGPKGFCTFACPYGAFFGRADKLALWRVRVDDNCEQCGHCTAVCTSNVNVAEEVNRYGMVVDPGCMKCMDCVQVCPNDALSISFGKPAVFARASKPAKQRRYDLSLTMEFVTLIVFMFVLVTVNGLYGQFPFLVSLAIAGISAFVFMKAVGLFTSRDVLLQKIRLKTGGRLQPAGWAFGAATILLFTGYAHSAVWRYHDIGADHPDYNVWNMLMNRGFQEYAPPEYLGWQYQPTYLATIDSAQMAKVDRGIRHFEAANAWGLFDTATNHYRLGWLYLCKNERDRAVEQVRRAVELAGDRPLFWKELAKFETAAGNDSEARAAYEQAMALETEEYEALARKTGIERSADSAEIWADWGTFLASRGERKAAESALAEAVAFDPSSAQAVMALARFREGIGDGDGARNAYVEAIERVGPAGELVDGVFSIRGAPQDYAAAAKQFERLTVKYPKTVLLKHCLASAYMQSGNIDGAVKLYSEIVKVNPDDIHARFDYGALLFVLTDLKGAEREFRAILERQPKHAPAAFRLGVTYLRMGRSQDAMAAFRITRENGTAADVAELDALMRDLGLSGPGNPGASGDRRD